MPNEIKPRIGRDGKTRFCPNFTGSSDDNCPRGEEYNCQFMCAPYYRAALAAKEAECERMCEDCPEVGKLGNLIAAQKEIINQAESRIAELKAATEEREAFEREKYQREMDGGE